jgi:hypothetical protein
MVALAHATALQQKPYCGVDEHREDWRGDHPADHRRRDALRDFRTSAMPDHGNQASEHRAAGGPRSALGVHDVERVGAPFSGRESWIVGKSKYGVRKIESRTSSLLTTLDPSQLQLHAEKLLAPSR